MAVKRYTVPITTATGGAGTGYTTRLSGSISSIRYVPHGSTPYAATVDIVITGETTGTPILTLTDVSGAFTYYPRAATHDVLGAASLYAAGGEPVEDKIPLCQERVKIVLAQGGDAKLGTFYVTVE